MGVSILNLYSSEYGQVLCSSKYGYGATGSITN
jgi:hypothetical protein